MAYVTRVRRERVSVDELVRRVQADEEARRTASVAGLARRRGRRRCRSGAASGAVVAFGVVVVFLASCGRIAEPPPRPSPVSATVAGR